jgi:hypothetical protein
MTLRCTYVGVEEIASVIFKGSVIHEAYLKWGWVVPAAIR